MGVVPQLARHQLGALVATLIDFGVMIALVEVGFVGPVVATAFGAACGALGNFWMSLLTATRHATSCFDELGSGIIRLPQIFGIDFWVLVCLILCQALLALMIFCYSANSAIRRIR